MKTLIGLLCMITLSSVAGCGSSAPTSNSGDARLKGTWNYTQVVNNGKETPADLMSRAPTVTFGDGTMIRKKGDEIVDNWTYKVDTTHDPMRLTITMGEPGKEKDYHHYYRIDGDTLTTCHANKKFSNPFNATLEPGAYFTVYTRVKG